MTDPRRPGGDISGPGGPHDRHAVVIDATDAVLLDNTHLALVEPQREGEDSTEAAVAMKLSGKINQADERAEILFLMPIKGCANLVAEVIGLFSRATFDPAIQADFIVALDALLAEVPGGTPEQ